MDFYGLSLRPLVVKGLNYVFMTAGLFISRTPIMFVSYSLCLCYVHDFVKVRHGNVFPPPTKCVLSVQQENNGSILCYLVLMSNAAILG